MQPNFVKGCGPARAKLMIVGEAPGYDEDQTGLPFVGRSGKFLNAMLQEAGVNRNDCYITNVVKYKPPHNDFKKLNEIGVDYDQQLGVLWDEVKAIQPNAILALGNESLKALTGKSGISLYRGSILQSSRGFPKVIPTLHPAAFLHSAESGALPNWMRYISISDIRRANEQSRSRDFHLPNRTLVVAKSSADVYNFIKNYKDSGKVSVDIEAINCVPVCVALAFNKYSAISIPLFRELFDLKLCTIPHADLANCWKMIAQVLEDENIKKIGQNFKYDQDKLSRLGLKVNNFHADTMLMSHTWQPEFRHGLAFLTSVFTEEPYYKDEGKEYNPRRDSFDTLCLYNAKDAAVTFEIYEELCKELEEFGLTSFYFDYVNRLHNLYLSIENAGLRLDYDVRALIQTKYDLTSREHYAQMIYALSQLGHNEVFNPRSPIQLKRIFTSVLKLPPRASTDEDTVFAMLANVAKTDEQKMFLTNLLDYRKALKALTTYARAEPDFDGRMRTSYRITGTETGRSSTAKMGPPIRPSLPALVEDPDGIKRKKNVEVGLAFQTITKHGEIGNELREMVIPDPGFVFIECDLSQAEARIVALLARDEATLKLFDTVDIHSVTASWCLGIPKESVKKGSAERHIGKMVRHGGNYNMGKKRLMIEVNTSAKKYNIPVNLSEWKAGKILEKFHEYTPKIRAIFHAEVRTAIEETRVLINPYGRRRMFWDHMGEELFKEAFAFLPQSTVADKLKHSMLEAKDEMPELQILVEAHDAFLCQVPEQEAERYARAILRILNKPIDFSGCTLSRSSLVIPAEAEIGENWKNLRKFNVMAA